MLIFLSHALGRKKRKLLNSSACQTEKTLVEQYLKHYSGRKNFMYCNEVLKEPYTYLCCKCQKLLVKHHHLEEELATVTTQIDVIFEALFRGVHSVSDNDNTDFGSITGTNQPSQTSTAQSSVDSPGVSVSKLYFNNLLLLGLIPNL